MGHAKPEPACRMPLPHPLPSAFPPLSCLLPPYYLQYLSIETGTGLVWGRRQCSLGMAWPSAACPSNPHRSFLASHSLPLDFFLLSPLILQTGSGRDSLVVTTLAVCPYHYPYLLPKPSLSLPPRPRKEGRTVRLPFSPATLYTRFGHGIVWLFCTCTCILPFCHGCMHALPAL